jgi:predicted ester cyclase
LPGIEDFKQFLTMQNAAFSDRRVTFEDLIAEGDKVVARLTMMQHLGVIPAP